MLDLTEKRRTETERTRLMIEAQVQHAARERAEKALHASEEQFRQAQKMEAIGRLAGGVAHDFNNVLSVILSYGEMMATELERGSPLRDDLEEIRKAAQRAASLTRQLLLFSRQQICEPRVVDLNSVLSSMRQLLQRLLGEDVELALPESKSVGRVKVDPSHIEQVLMNLVVNARDAMPTGGRLTIETADVVLDDTFMQAHFLAKPGPHVMLAVSDTGCGMDAQTRARIFEPFFTTKEQGKGTGLGLSTVFGIVQRSGGSIWVYSEVGEGSTFKIYLPRVDNAIETAPQRAPTPSTLRGAENVLLVEDEEQVRAIALSVLRKFGYRVTTAKNADEALRVCADELQPLDLLVTDVVMPGMSGPELARRIKAARPEIKVLCMSGYTDDSIVRHGVLESGVAYLQKPFTPDSLAHSVRAALDAGGDPSSRDEDA